MDYCLFPIKHLNIFNFYKKQLSSFWTVEEIDLTQDILDFEVLNPKEKHYIKFVLAFFAASDAIVCENLALNFFNAFDMQVF